ncbi:nucleoside monophosphate kinase [Candidatus Wolfebacteria bacterium]|nr:nucleoside monophosphate kinase [Candidatus Wolfebacteria bacterium]
MNHPKIIIVIGPPGSGKGTQADLLIKKFKLRYLGSGSLLRARAKKRDFTGKKIDSYLSKGFRMSTPVIFKMWMDKFESFKNDPKFKGFVFDGSPRTLSEAELLEEALKWYGWGRDMKFFFIDISEKEAINRLTKRRICSECKKIIPYLDGFKNLKKCDRCGGKLKKRADDTMAGIKERLHWFKLEVRPAIDFYKKKKGFYRIDGKQSIEETFKDILKGLK